MEKNATRKIGRHRRYCSYNQYCLLVLLVPMLLFLLSAGALTTQAHTTQFDTNQASSAAQPTYAVGDTFCIGSLQYKITGVKTIAEHTNLNKLPRKGYQFLVIGLTIDNQGQKDVEVRSSIGFELKDIHGNKQDPSMGAILAVRQPIDGTIRAGETASGEIGYEVKKDAEHFNLSVIPDPLSSKAQVVTVSISLN